MYTSCFASCDQFSLVGFKEKYEEIPIFLAKLNPQ